jgi:hypothetical protein
MTTEPERAYLAGLIDGEGSIFATFRESDQCTTVRVNICNTDARLIDWVAARWRGRQSVTDRVKYEQKPIHRWDADGSNAVEILRAALPYLVIKREQADLAFQLIATTHNHGRRGYPPEVKEHRLGLVRQLQAMNRRGRPA